MASAPTFADSADDADPDPLKRVTFDLPTSIVHWLEALALHEKQRRGAGHAGKSPIVTEALQEYRARLEAKR